MTRRPTRRLPARRIAATALTGALAVAAAVALPASAASPVGAVKTLSRNVAISANTYVSPIASSTNTSSFGDKTFAVYERHNVEGRVLDPSGQLVAVPNGGTPQVFGVVTPDMSGFSLSGYTLTAVSSADPTKVYWWQPPNPNATFDIGTLGAGDHYLASAPDGWVEIAADGTLYDVSAGAGESSARSLGNPFHSATGVQGVAGPIGVVVYNASKISFVPYSGGAITPLDTSKITALGGGTNTPICTSVSSVAVACSSYYNSGEDDSGLKNVFIDPLDGAPAYATSDTCAAGATMLGSTAAWASRCNGKIILLGKSGTRTINKTFNGGPVAGLGGYLFAGDKGHSGVRLSADGAKTTTILPTKRATSEASSFALTSTSIAWIENDGSAAAAVHRRSLAANQFQTGVKAGAIGTLGSSKVTKGLLAAAGSTVVYGTQYTNSSVGQSGSETLRVVTPGKSVTINGADRYLSVQLGDHRVLYFTDNSHARLYNLKTHKTAKLAATGAALDGQWLAYCGTDGIIRLKDLESGSVRQVATGMQLISGQIYVHGQVVGWNAYQPHTTNRIGYYRDLATSAAAVTLPVTENIWSVTDAGVVLEDSVAPASSSTQAFPFANGLRNHRILRFRLQNPDAAYSPTLLLTGQYLFAGPQVRNGVIAWIDEHGVLRSQLLG